VQAAADGTTDAWQQLHLALQDALLEQLQQSRHPELLPDLLASVLNVQRGHQEQIYALHARVSHVGFSGQQHAAYLEQQLHYARHGLWEAHQELRVCKQELQEAKQQHEQLQQQHEQVQQQHEQLHQQVQDMRASLAQVLQHVQGSAAHQG
jgi:CII-binding regulator of phage lambda lysogenization HflD